MNEENLKKGNPDTQFQTGREQVEIARQGGITSGKSRRKKADTHKLVQQILDDTYKDKTEKKTFSGVEGIVISLLKTALDSKNKNSIAAAKMLLDIYNGKDVDKLAEKKTRTEIKLLEARINALTNSDTTALDKLDEILENIKSNAEKQNSEGET